MSTATLSGHTSNGAQGSVRRLVTLFVAGSLATSGLVALEAVAPSSVQAAVDCNPAAPTPGADALPLLQAAVDGCDEVTLGEGDYPLSNSLVVGKRPNVTIRGVGKPGAVDPNSAGGSRIMLGAGVKNVGVVSIGGATPVTVTIDGVTIMGGLARGNGGGISVASNATLNLKNSTVRKNKATEGAGIENNGTLFVTSSTFLNNEASKKGGGIRSQGTATIVNSTFQGNSASQGGAISTPGSGKVIHSTITKNFSTSSSSAGLDRNGGSLQVFYSIIGDNTRTNLSPAADCSGTPELIGYNIVTDLSGCNPVGKVVQVPAADLGLDLLGAYGGPTLTRALVDTTPVGPAVDKIGSKTDCASATTLGRYGLSSVGLDQRGTTRPTGDGCDVGAFELAEFGIENFEFDVNTDAYKLRGYGDRQVEVGVTSVPIDDIAGALSAPVTSGSEADSIESSGVRNIGVRNIGVRNIGVRNIGVRNIGVRNIELETKFGIDTFITRIPLSEIPLLASANGDGLGLVPDGWSIYLDGTQYDGWPLQTLTLEILDSAPPTPLTVGYRTFDEITLEDIDLSNSVLGEIALSSAALADVPLKDIPAPREYTSDSGAKWWCVVFADLCTRIGSVALGELDLLSVQLAGGNVDDVDVASVDLGGTLKAIGVRNIGVRNIGVRNINIQNSGVRNIGVRNIELIVNCASALDPCNPAKELTIGDLFDAWLLGNDPFAVGATVGDLIDAILVSLESNPNLLDGLTLADFLALFAPTDQVPWEQIDLDNVELQNLGDQPAFHYVTSFTVTGSSADSLEVALTLPGDFVLAARSVDEVSKLTGPAGSSWIVPPTVDGARLLYEFPDSALGPGDYELKVPVLAGIVTSQESGARAELTAVGSAVTVMPKPEGTVSVEVVEAKVLENPSSGTVRAGALNFGHLQLAHIAGAGGVDLYKFEVPADQDGATARVFLSNIPDNVDYDLSIYAPTATPLRAGTSDGSRKSIGDIRYDLDPGDDIFPTDLADDIDLDVLATLGRVEAGSHVLTDISSRRTNSDEEVVIPALRKGTYFVAVTSYLGNFNPRPYAIRLRIDEGTALPECWTGQTIEAPLDLGTVQAKVLRTNPASGGLEFNFSDKTNTLYLTNLERLASAFPGEYADIVDNAIATRGVPLSNPVTPTIVDFSADVAGELDNDVRDAYDAWAVGENRCDPEIRNDVVGAIGELLDSLPTEGVENIVILGDDGIVPMAAVPDLTGYSNEATYARDVLTGGLSNEVSGALGSGYLLSDDPYGTSSGIEVRNAGHQLYLPDVSVGRLVETGKQISDQLFNFKFYEGQLDPGTLPVSSAVTGYDFLRDGAEDVTDQLDRGTDVTTDVTRGAETIDLLGDDWNKADYLTMLDGGPDIISPNAHYDHEALLPAAADGTLYSNEELVLTKDVAPKEIEKTLLFTMGCHAGLNVSDVQLGFKSPDWAETLATGDNQWLAHTTYGYGDDEIVAYSERLAALFAGNVSDHILGGAGTPTSLGEAMVRAKQEYLATTFTLTPYDEKILQSWTYYGLPMYEIRGSSTGADTLASNSTTAVVTSASLPASAATNFGSETTVDGMTVTPYSVDLGRTVGRSGPNNLNLVEAADGDYYEVGGNTVTAQQRPVQPLVSEPIPAQTDAAGFLITGLTSTDVRPFSPLYLRPTVDLSGNERRVAPGEGSFPANLQLVTDDGTGSERLLLAAGQYRAGADPNSGTQRLYTSISGELYHSVGSDGIGPQFVGIDADLTTSRITVTTADTAERVVVLYQPRNSSTWRTLEPDRTDGKVWTAPLPATTDAGPPVEFLVQAVDRQGDVSISNNKVENFLNSGDPDGGPLTITALSKDGLPANDAGYFNTDVIVTISAAAASDFDFVSLDRVEVLQYPANETTLVIEVKGDGVHVIFARDSSGSGQIFSVTIDSTDPVIKVSSPVESPTPWSQGPVTVNFLAVDLPSTAGGFSSGVASITYMVDGEIVDPTGPGSVTVPRSGTVSAFATDLAGNDSTTASVAVRIDKTKPVVEIAPTPAAGWAKSFAVSLWEPAPDGQSPTRIEYQIGTGTGPDDLLWRPYEATTPVTMNEEGTSIWARASDDAGNVSEVVTVAPQIDVTVPNVVTIGDIPLGPIQLGDVVVPTATCSDALSGIKSCALTGVLANGQLDTSSVGTKTVTLTATDNAGDIGNARTATVNYTVGYRVCELYDWTKPASAGAANPIKLQLCDATGKNLSSPNIKLTAIIATNTATGAQLRLEPDFSGGSNTGYEFRFGSKTYVYNLKTDGFPPGPYVLGFVTTPSSLKEDERAAIVADNGSTSFARFTIG